MTTLRLIKSIGRSSSRLALLLIPLVFACFALSPMAQAVSPPPDGGYPGQNTAEGDDALLSLSPTEGGFNTAIGWLSLFANTTGSFNTGVGAATLWQNTAHNNTAVGAGALTLNTTGDGNTANGAFALLQNTVGRGNTAVGGQALFSNTTGAGNTAVGARALLNNTTPVGKPPGISSSLNTAVGLNALTANTTGGGNTAVGAGTNNGPAGPAPLGSNTTGGGNTAVGATTGLGAAALGSNTTGSGNTAIGAGGTLTDGALGSNTTGEDNTAIGGSALAHNTTGSSNIAVGIFAGVSLSTGNNNIDIGNPGVEAEANTIRIGTDPEPTASPTPTPATYIAHISGATASGGVAVFVNAVGKLGTLTSSARFKDEIKPMDKASKAILALKPVTFRYKKGIDPQRIPQFGLVAEEVEKVNPDLVVRDQEGKPYTVRYEAVNAMLLNEFLNEHKAFLEEHRTVEELKKQVAALTVGLQKVSAQLETSKPATQVVNNNQ